VTRSALARLVASLAAAGALGTVSTVATASASPEVRSGQVPAAVASAPVPLPAVRSGVLPEAESTLPERWTARGYSGALRVAVTDPGSALDTLLELSELQRTKLRYRRRTGGESRGTTAGQAGSLAAGLRAPALPGLWTLYLGERGERETRLQVLTRILHDGRSDHLNGYHLGHYPRGAVERLGERYAPPRHFIEVTRENQDTRVSEHFQLRDFLTKDQRDVWPKYLVLDLALVDKLELVIQELQRQGFATRGLHVMSGFRTPQYNGPGEGGRAKYSRHTYGDAADVWVDDDGDGQMDDLNGDGRVDVEDAEALAAVVDRVEARLPALVGGHGVYKATSAHGPFVHVDLRGTPARWANR
jgi:Peptidase M15